jgi:anti-anti-sigma factor
MVQPHVQLRVPARVPPSVPPRFALKVSQVQGVYEVRLTGELDLLTAGRLRDVLVGLPGPSIVVDVSGLEFIDAAGLSALVLGLQREERDGDGERCLSVKGARGLVRRVIELGGLGELLAETAA